MTTWYVRPAGGSYGSEDGTSYADAWNGGVNVVQGAGGVEAGDDLYVCGPVNDFPALSVSGSAGNVITIRGDYPGDPGSITKDGANAVNLNGQDYITFQSITLATTTSAAAVFMPGGQNITFKNVEITESANHGYAMAGGNGVTHADYAWIGGSIANCAQAGIRLLVSAAGATCTLDKLIVDGIRIAGNAGDGIEIRSESDVNVATKFTNLEITNNTIIGNGSHGIRIAHSGGQRHDDLVVTGNTVTGNGAGTSGGGISIVGFGSSGDRYGDVNISGNNSSGNDGPTGGIVASYCEYARINGNICSNNTVPGSTIDGCGIDIDVGNSDVEVWQNTCSGNGGSSSENSGAGIMILQNTNVKVWANLGTGNKDGIRIGGGDNTNLKVVANNFAECAEDGLRIAVAQSDAIIKSNIFAGADGNSGYKVSGTAGDTSDEAYNNFFGFQNETEDFTLDATTKSVEPSFDANLLPHNRELIAAGVKVPGVDVGYDGVWFQPEPTIGAFEMFRRRMVMVAGRGGQTVRRPRR